MWIDFVCTGHVIIKRVVVGSGIALRPRQPTHIKQTVARMMRFIVFILRPKAAIGGNCVHERMRPEAEGLAALKYRDRVLGLLSFLLVTTYLDCAYISVAEPRNLQRSSGGAVAVAMEHSEEFAPRTDGLPVLVTHDP